VFCDKCGSTLNPGAQYCNVCGKQVIQPAGPVPSSAAPQPVAPQDRVRRNLQLLMFLWLAYGVIRLLGVFWLLIFGRVILPGFLGPWSHWTMMSSWNWFLPLGLLSAGFFAAAFAAAYLLLAWSLYEKRPWARGYGIILGFLVLFHVPFGTALGIYTLWVLLPDTSRREYHELARA